MVKHKTTIPILSNYLFEAAGDRLSLTATDLDLSLNIMQRQSKKRRILHHPGAQTSRLRKLLPDADITVELLENHWVTFAAAVRTRRWLAWRNPIFPASRFQREAQSRFQLQVCAV